jgi:hypothetical protein
VPAPRLRNRVYWQAIERRRDLNARGVVVPTFRPSAAWFEHTVGLEVLFIGRPANSREDCVLELSGRQLLRIAIRGGWIWVSACSMDEPGQPQLLFNVADGPQGWTTVRRFVQALERTGIKSLRERPVEIGGGSGPLMALSSPSMKPRAS